LTEIGPVELARVNPPNGGVVGFGAVKKVGGLTPPALIVALVDVESTIGVVGYEIGLTLLRRPWAISADVK
jgi:hypothetical protein